MNFLKIASLVAASAAFATVASAQTLGTHYVGIGTNSITLDTIPEDIEGWSYGVEYHRSMMEWDSSGFDVNVSLSYSEIDNFDTELNSTTLVADAIYYMELGGQFRPFAGATLGLSWQDLSTTEDEEEFRDLDDDHNTLIVGALIGGEYVFNEQISIKADARWVYLQEQEIDEWTLNLEGNYWFDESFGAAVNISVGERDESDLVVYGISLRYRL